MTAFSKFRSYPLECLSQNLTFSRVLMLLVGFYVGITAHISSGGEEMPFDVIDNDRIKKGITENLTELR